MDISYIRMDTDMMKNTISDMQSLLDQLQETANQAYNDVAELDTMWDGAANTAFKNEFRRDKNHMQTLIMSIREYLIAFNNAREEYRACENQVEELVRLISI